MTPEGKFKGKWVLWLKKCWPSAEFSHFKSPNFPDLQIFHEGKIYLVEFKAKNGKESKGQVRMRKLLERKKFIVNVLTEGNPNVYLLSSSGEIAWPEKEKEK